MLDLPGVVSKLFSNMSRAARACRNVLSLLLLHLQVWSAQVEVARPCSFISRSVALSTTQSLSFSTAIPNLMMILSGRVNHVAPLRRRSGDSSITKQSWSSPDAVMTISRPCLASLLKYIYLGTMFDVANIATSQHLRPDLSPCGK